MLANIFDQRKKMHYVLVFPGSIKHFYVLSKYLSMKISRRDILIERYFENLQR